MKTKKKAQKKQTDDQIFAEVQHNWLKLMNSLIKAYHVNDMTIELTCKTMTIHGWDMQLPEKEYTKKDVEEGTSDGVNIQLKLEKTYYTE